ncbi:MAG TPA: PIG-L family deacetylase [Acidimicrobiales bacterium]|nr:PIG-L family deacetylase [Acidimicrobiales bacterium]
MAATVLVVSPHPDDEIVGCGATLLALRDAGWRVVNLACSLGRGPARDRRRAELEAALAVVGFEGLIAPSDVPLVDSVVSAARRVGADLVVSPHCADGHPAHEAAGRAVAAAGPDLPSPRWWAWGLWADLPAPNLYVPWARDRLAELTSALRCHAGEVSRNPYDDLLAARGRVGAILGSERVFGFGAPAASALPYADLLTEACFEAGSWRPSPARLAVPDDPARPL